jgi:hypothetical protein
VIFQKSLSGECPAKTLISLGFDYEVLKSLNIENLSHVHPVLNGTMTVNRDIVSNIVIDIIGNTQAAYC